MPTLKTFEDFDKFQLNEFGYELTNFIAVERQFVEGSLVLSINSPFGTGKSTFFEMWKNQLQQAAGEIGVVLLNAWQEDYIDDPLLAITRSTLATFDEFWRELPNEWLYSELDNSNDPRYTPEIYLETLRRPLTQPEAFWNALLQ